MVPKASTAQAATAIQATDVVSAPVLASFPPATVPPVVGLSDAVGAEADVVPEATGAFAALEAVEELDACEWAGAEELFDVGALCGDVEDDGAVAGAALALRTTIR